VTRSGWGSRRNAAGLTNPSITTVDSLTAQKRLIEAGLGVALMPLASIREELRIGSLRIVAVSGVDARIPVVAVRRPGGHLNPAAAAFLAALSAHGSRLGQGTLTESPRKPPTKSTAGRASSMR
jgi:DNA-binding transcriptional LysR family regulator